MGSLGFEIVPNGDDLSAAFACFLLVACFELLSAATVKARPGQTPGTDQRRDLAFYRVNGTSSNCKGKSVFALGQATCVVSFDVG